MTAKQHQCLLGCLGYYQGAMDGIWGPESRKAAREFQKAQGLTADGVIGKESEKALLRAIAQLGNQKEPEQWQGIRNFTRQEFACQCGRYCNGFPTEPDPGLLKLAQQVRDHFGSPVTVSSGLRCQKHNANVGGVSNSRHLSGKAMDFSVAGKSSAQVLAYVTRLSGLRYAYAIDSQYVHMDVN